MFRKCIRKIRHLIIKLRILATEKIYEKSGHRVRYLYIPKKGTKALAVIFSAFPAPGKPAGYNLIDTLAGEKCNRLYILDDFGYEKRGSYYLGENGEFFLSPVISSLINEFSGECEKKVFIGSSKGGSAALFYGLYCNANAVIIGAPQYYLGDYLTCKEEHVPIMDAIMGGHDEAKVKELNHTLPLMVKKCNSKEHIKIYLHYSPKETTFLPHIKPMLDDLKLNGYAVVEDVEYYTSHGDVACFFPEFCKKMIQEIC